MLLEKLQCLVALVAIFSLFGVEFVDLQLFWLNFFIAISQLRALAVPLQKEKPKQNFFNDPLSFLFETQRKELFNLLENEMQNFLWPKEAPEVSFLQKSGK